MAKYRLSNRITLDKQTIENIRFKDKNKIVVIKKQGNFLEK